MVIQATTLPEEPKKGKVLDYPLAVMPGFFLSTSSPWLKGHYKLLLGTIPWDLPTPREGDWHCSPHAEPGSMAFISLSSLRQWENVTCMGLHFRSTLDHILGGMASLIK